VPDPDIDEWWEREHKRRQAWLNGPTDSEKRAWVERRRTKWYDPPHWLADPYDADYD
jgi:hypothetical protein